MATMNESADVSNNKFQYQSCYVYQCTRKKLKKYRFPNPKYQLDLFLDWLNACQDANLINLPRDQIHEMGFVCEAHFKDSDFIPYSDKKLIKSAVPSLHLPKVEEFVQPVKLECLDLPIGKPDKSLTNVELQFYIPFKDLPYLYSEPIEHINIETVCESFDSILDQRLSECKELQKTSEKIQQNAQITEIDLALKELDRTETNLELYLDYPLKDLPYLFLDTEDNTISGDSNQICPRRKSYEKKKLKKRYVFDIEENETTTNFNPLSTVECRICLAHTIQYFSILEKPEIGKMLESLTLLKISNSTNLASTVICLKCLLNLKLAYSIQQKMLKAEQSLQEKLTNDKLNMNQEHTDIIKNNGNSIKRKKKRVKPKIKVKKRKQSECGTANLESCRECDQKYKLEYYRSGSLCELCGRTMSASDLGYHQLITHLMYSYKCKFCDKIFTNKFNRDIHQSNDHYSEPRFMCHICGRTFRLANYFRSHVFHIHYKKRPLVCKICGASYRKLIALKMHQRIHVNGTLFTCGICDEQFTIKWDLRKHLMWKHNIFGSSVSFVDNDGYEVLPKSA